MNCIVEHYELVSLNDISTTMIISI